MDDCEEVKDECAEEYRRPSPLQRIKKSIERLERSVAMNQQLITKMNEFLSNQELVNFVEEHQDVLDIIF